MLCLLFSSCNDKNNVCIENNDNIIRKTNYLVELGVSDEYLLDESIALDRLKALFPLKNLNVSNLVAFYHYEAFEFKALVSEYMMDYSFNSLCWERMQ